MTTNLLLLKLPQILRSFSLKERLIFMAAFFIFLTTFLISLLKFIEANTVLVPINSGEYTEGIVGQPIFINPVLAENNTPDSDIDQLIFASLKNLTDTYSVSDNRTTFTIRIKGDLTWQDSRPLTTDDIIFTLEAIQDPDTNSPLYSNWKGVKFERISEREMKITLPHPYAFFENILLSLKPIPKHIFADIPFAHMKLSNYNIEPVGSGAFVFSGFSKQNNGFITEITLKRNDGFSDAKPRLDKFGFRFYSAENDLIKDFNSGNIDGFSLSDQKSLSSLHVPRQIFDINMPRYYAVFLNSSGNPLLKDDSIKTSLNYATDKAGIMRDIFGNNGFSVNGPVLIDGNAWDGSHEFSIDKANQLLDSAGWAMNSDGIREIKTKVSDQKLEFNLTVYPAPFLLSTAKILQESWKKIGVKINLVMPSPADFQNSIIKPRNYDMLLFGNIYGENQDLFSFWHSSQKFYPGLNLSLYENKNADFLIELIRTDFNPQKRVEELKKLQSTIEADQPAIFLYSPDYIYVSTKSLKGFDKTNISLPSERFSDIQNWYVKTARVLK